MEMNKYRKGDAVTATMSNVLPVAVPILCPHQAGLHCVDLQYMKNNCCSFDLKSV